MPRGKASGIKLSTDDIPIVLGMQKRGDREHDIAAWFGVNQGRIAEAKDGRFDHIQPAPSTELPPKGPPGIKGRDLRDRMQVVLTLLQEAGVSGDAVTHLRIAIRNYDSNER